MTTQPTKVHIRLWPAKWVRQRQEAEFCSIRLQRSLDTMRHTLYSASAEKFPPQLGLSKILRPAQHSFTYSARHAHCQNIITTLYR